MGTGLLTGMMRGGMRCTHCCRPTWRGGSIRGGFPFRMVVLLIVLVRLAASAMRWYDDPWHSLLI
jgi:hypothetical protein